jgi:hypothetical protein
MWLHFVQPVSVQELCCIVGWGLDRGRQSCRGSGVWTIWGSEMIWGSVCNSAKKRLLRVRHLHLLLHLVPGPILLVDLVSAFLNLSTTECSLTVLFNRKDKMWAATMWSGCKEQFTCWSICEGVHEVDRKVGTLLSRLYQGTVPCACNSLGSLLLLFVILFCSLLSFVACLDMRCLCCLQFLCLCCFFTTTEFDNLYICITHDC